MMKKLIALLVALAMIAALAACGTTEDKNEDQTTTGAVDDATGESNDSIGEEPENDINDGEQNDNEDTVTANDIMNDVWGKIPADQKPTVIGGHYSNEYTEGPASYEMAYAEELAGMLLIPQDQMAYIVDAATAVHMMNANSMTIGLVKLSEGADMQAFADGVYDSITNNQWMCGFPEKLIISQVHGNYLLIAYGLNDLLNAFEGQLDQAWTSSDFYNEAIG